MIRQNPLTLVTPVKNEEHRNLDTLLMKIRRDVINGLPQQFEDLNTIHYARWVLLEPKDADGKIESGIGVRLVFSSDFDGDENEHLTDLATKCGQFLDDMYSYCEGYPSANERTPESRKNYLARWRVKSSAFFAGAPGRTLPQIRQENELRNHIWKFIHAGSWNNKSANEIHNAIKQSVLEEKRFEWAKPPAEILKVRWLGMAFLGLVLLILLPFYNNLDTYH